MTSNVLHAGLPERWGKLSILEQLGNIGSEVERTIRAHEGANSMRFTNSLARALELFDFTAADPR